MICQNIGEIIGLNIEESVKEVNKVIEKSQEVEDTQIEDVDTVDNIYVPISDEQLEDYFDMEFALMEDPAESLELAAEMDIGEINVAQLGPESILQDFEFEELEGQVLPGVEPDEFIDKDKILEGVEQPPENVEEEYQAPMIEEKTGFAALLDKMKTSRNPVTRFFANRIVSFQNRNNKRLASPDNQKQPEGVSSSSLVPVIPERNPVKRAMNSIGKGIMGLFKTNTKESQPTNTLKPISVSNLDKMVEVSQEVKDGTVSVGIQAGIKEAQRMNGITNENGKSITDDSGTIYEEH